jgi:hypothetical protein
MTKRKKENIPGARDATHLEPPFTMTLVWSLVVVDVAAVVVVVVAAVAVVVAVVVVVWWSCGGCVEVSWR